MIMIAGVLNTLYGIAAIDKANFFIRDAKYVFADLATFGWFVLILGAVQIFAAFAIWSGTPWGRWFGVACASANVILQMLWIPHARKRRRTSGPTECPTRSEGSEDLHRGEGDWRRTSRRSQREEYVLRVADEEGAPQSRRSRRGCSGAPTIMVSETARERDEPLAVGVVVLVDLIAPGSGIRRRPWGGHGECAPDGAHRPASRVAPFPYPGALGAPRGRVAVQPESGDPAPTVLGG